MLVAGVGPRVATVAGVGSLAVTEAAIMMVAIVPYWGAAAAGAASYYPLIAQCSRQSALRQSN